MTILEVVMRRWNFPLAMIVSALCALLVIPGASLQGSVQEPQPRPGTRIPANPNDLGSRLEPMYHRIYAPLGPLGSWPNTMLVLNNRGTTEITVEPTLFARAIPFAASPIVLRSGEVRWVSIRELGATLPRSADTIDGIELTYFGQLLEVAAQIAAKRHGRGNADVMLSGSADYRTGRLAAVWWRPFGGRAVITLANASDAPIRAVVHDVDGSRSLDLAPKATSTLTYDATRSDKAAASDWISIENEGTSGSLRAVGFVQRGGHVLSTIRFSDPGKARGADLFGSGLRTKNTEIRLALLSLAEEPISATVKIFSADREGSLLHALPPLRIHPRQSVLVDTDAIERLARRRGIERVSVQVISDSAEGKLLGQLTAVDNRSDLSFDVPLKDLGPLRQSTGSYPWRLDGDYSTIVSVVNVGSVSAMLGASVTFPGGVYWLRTEELSPHATAVFDLRHLRDGLVPDRDGNVLPEDASGGQFTWTIVSRDPSARFLGRAEVASVRAGISSSYSCGQCCPDSFYYGYTSPTTVWTAEGIVSGFNVWGQLRTCYGGLGPNYPVSGAIWDVQYPSIVSVYNTGTGTAGAQGGDGGSSNFVGGWTDVVYEAYIEDCLSSYVPAEAPGTAQTQVPTSLTVVSGSYTDNPPPPYNYRRVYQIRDQNGNAMQGYAPNGLNVTETYTPNPPSGNCTADEVVTGSGYADGNGRFTDDYKLTGSPPNPCSSTSTQKHFVNGRQVSTISVQWQYSGVTVGNP